jgi:hypothetical protein
VTDISSEGSLPQLTDVLYLLTDSQDLLLLKIQSMRMEYTRSARSAPERAPSTVNATPSAERVSTDDNDAHAVRSTPAPASPVSNVTNRLPVVTVLPLGDTTLPETTTAESRTAESRTRINAHAEVFDPVDSAPSIPTDSANRSYNFFDELDERLADLEHPDAAS